MSAGTFYLTTAIDYPNGKPHIGHAYEKILADVLTRYRRLRGEKAYFLTGIDHHGQKMFKTAETEGIPVAELAKRNTKGFIALWEKLNVRYDGWAETTDPRHFHCVRAVLTALHEKGDLYKKTHTGFYSVRQEQFLGDRDREADGTFGPEWGEVVELEEENWYFKLSEHQTWLREMIQSDTLRILPAFRKTEVVNALDRAGETDLCISRPKERLPWGIPLPFDSDFVTYVWFDALLNYASFAGYLKEEGSDLPEFETLWPPDLQIIGKDILIPAHAIYWPAMLHAAGFEAGGMPTLLVHGFWNVKGEKMSKSLKNVVDPNELADLFGAEALRFYLCRDISSGRDADFDPARLVMLFNTELANELGNLLNRSLNMTKRFLDSVIQPGGEDGEEEIALKKSLAEAIAAYREAMDRHEPGDALRALNGHVSHCNGYAERNKPWELAKDEKLRPRLETVLGHLCESCAQLAILFSPVLPEASANILGQLNAGHLGELKLDDLRWGLLPPGHRTGGKPTPVFPRLELEAEE